MSTVKLCTYSKSFYPYVWGMKTRVIVGAYVVIEDGEILKRSFRDCREYLFDDHAENEAFARGLEWIVQNMDDLRDTNLQVFFCGASRNSMKKRVDENTLFASSRTLGGLPTEDPVVFPGNEKLFKLFNKVTYHTASRVTIHDGENDDPESAETFDMYSAVSKFFALVYGDDINYGHTVYQTENSKMQLVGLPELRCNNNSIRWT
jgi:hypothetical protein